jgi:uncharacterized protein YdaU (DUF1376 family)
LNYYEHHIGDYLKDTAHLSLLEHGVYLRLLQVYYTREHGIPTAQAARLVGARTQEELEALETVLREFFDISEGGIWTQKRCEELIEKHQQFIEKQKQAAAKRWGTNGNAGADAVGMPVDMPDACGGNADGIPPTSHFPLPTSQSQGREKRRASAPDRGTRIPDDFGLTPERIAAAEAEGLDPARTLQGFRDYWTARPGAGGRKADWDATWRVWCGRQFAAKTAAPRSNSIADRITYRPTE